ncbi:outer membrane beta-barrel protein [Hymenobacter sp. B81]|uniref:outer membrane beta-barrel protein n=1 Tax=Hymenobacter sp. B81 TaxID=3344878 RepID=UPI0037DCD877
MLSFIHPRAAVLLPVLLWLAPAASAQHRPNDFLILTNGDTLRGQIRQGLISKNYRNGVRFQPNGQKTTRYQPADIRGFGTGKQLSYRSAVLPATGQPGLVAPIVEGPVQAYVGEKAPGEKRFYLALPDSARLLELDPKTYRLQYIRALQGCAALDLGSATFNRDYPYAYRSVTRLLQQYNPCRYPGSSTRLVKPAQGWYFRPGVKVGLASATYKDFPASYGNEPQTNEMRPFAGVFVRVSNRSPFGAQVELNYLQTKVRFTGRNVYTGGAPYTVDRVTYIESNQLQAAVLANLFLYRGRISPFVNGGFVYERNLRHNSYQEIKRSDRPAAEVVDVNDLGDQNSGFAAGGGATVAVFGRSLLSLEYRYSWLVDGDISPAPRRRVARFDLGLSF